MYIYYVVRLERLQYEKKMFVEAKGMIVKEEEQGKNWVRRCIDVLPSWISKFMWLILYPFLLPMLITLI